MISPHMHYVKLKLQSVSMDVIWWPNNLHFDIVSQNHPNAIIQKKTKSYWQNWKPLTVTTMYITEKAAPRFSTSRGELIMCWSYGELSS